MMILVAIGVYLIFAATIAAHEYAHYWTMRRAGVSVVSFTVGTGPKLWSWENSDGVEFVYRLIPIVGYVKPLTEEEYDIEAGDVLLSNQRLRTRLVVDFAGVTVNIVIAYLSLTMAGFLQGDVWAPVYVPVVLVVATASLFTTPLTQDIAGPITSAQFIGNLVQAGPMSIFLAIGVLNFSVAIFNCVPIPPLDGGRAVMDVMQTYWRGKVGEIARNVYMVIGALIVLVIVVFAIGTDILHFAH